MIDDEKEAEIDVSSQDDEIECSSKINPMKNNEIKSKAEELAKKYGPLFDKNAYIEEAYKAVEKGDNIELMLKTFCPKDLI